MNKKTHIALVVTSIMILQGVFIPVFAVGPSGTITYNGNTIRVNDGKFTFDGITGEVDNNGDYKLSNGTIGNIGGTLGITEYQVDGQNAVSIVGPSGTITFKGQIIRVNNGQFSLDGITGTIDADGNFKLSNGNVGNIGNTEGVTAYQVDGQAAVLLGKPTGTTSQLTVTGIDSYGLYSKVDIQVLANSMKDGSYGINNRLITNVALSVLGYTSDDFEKFKEFVRTHTATEIASEIAKMPTDKIIALDEWRPHAGHGAMRLSPEIIGKMLLTAPESIGVVFEQAGISLSNGEITRYYSMNIEQIGSELKKLTNDQLEKIQSRFVATKNVCSGPTYTSLGSECSIPSWEDLPGFSPEIGRNVSAAEKNAIARIKLYTTLTVFNAGGELSAMSALGKQNWIEGQGWRKDTFKPYLTEAAIADYVKNPPKGAFAGGSGTNYIWGDSVSQRSSENTESSQSSPKYEDIILKNQTKIIVDTWLSTSIISQKKNLNSENYKKFVNSFIAEIETKIIKAEATKNSTVNEIKIMKYILVRSKEIVELSK